MSTSVPGFWGLGLGEYRCYIRVMYGDDGKENGSY